MDRWSTRTSLSSAALIAAAWMGVAGTASPASAADKPVDFKKDIQPIFKQSCIRCHSLDNPRHKAAADFRLDSKEEALKGGETGKDLVPGDADKSLLYRLLLGPVKDGDQEVDAMPKARKGEKSKALPKAKIALIKRWIDEGAEWPE